MKDSEHTEKALPRAKTPENAVSLKAVRRLFDEWQNENVAIHSFMLIKDGEVFAEAYMPPFKADDAHNVYSISKSFLSVAAGFALSEGALSEDTRFVDVFPEYKKRRDRYLNELTVRDLLAMRSGKHISVLKKRGRDYLKSFVRAPWAFRPGRDWRYVNENYYVLSKIICKTYGCSVNDFLKPRLYEPLGIKTPFWETSPDNTEAGGWGLHLKSEDIAKFILCCHNGGALNGRQIIPREYILKATSPLSNTSRSQRSPDSKAGYGFGFWQCAGAKDAFRCEGLYSQYAISLKEHNACVVITAGCADLQKTLDVFWKHKDSLFSPDGEACEEEPQLSPAISPEISKRTVLESRISGKTFKVKRKIFLRMLGREISFLPMQTVWFAKEPGGNIDNLRFDFCESGLSLSWSEKKQYKNKIGLAMDGTFKEGEIKLGEIKLKTLSCAKWLNESTLEAVIIPAGEVAARRFVFKFNKSKLTIIPGALPTVSENAAAIGEKIKCILPSAYFKMWVDILVPRVSRILQPKHKARIIKKRQPENELPN